MVGKALQIKYMHGAWRDKHRPLIIGADAQLRDLRVELLGCGRAARGAASRSSASARSLLPCGVCQCGSHLPKVK